MPHPARNPRPAPLSAMRPGSWAWVHAAAIALVCLSAVLIAYTSLVTDARTQAEREMRSAGEEIIAAIRAEFEDYEQLLYLARRFYESNPGVTRTEWAWFAESIGKRLEHPDIVGLAFVARVEPGSEEAFQNAQRQTGARDFTIYQPEHHDRRGHNGPKFVITYHEPAERNREVWGLDLSSNSANRAIYDESLLLDRPQLSNALTLHQQAFRDCVGTILCTPIFSVDLSGETPSRGEQLGWAALAINADSVFDRVLQGRWDGLDIQITGNRPGTEPARWYHRTGPERGACAETTQPASGRAQPGPAEPTPPGAGYARTIHLFGNTLTVGWSSANGVWGKPDLTAANTVFVAGMIITLLVLLVSISVMRTRAKAIRLAREMTDSLRVSERTQRDMALNAERANLAKSEFLANMSHEIRTPMTAIMGYTDILRERLASPADRESIHAIRRAGEHLLMIINDVLDLSKVEAGRFEVTDRPTELATVFADAMSGFRLAAQEQGLSLDARILGDVPTHIHTDPVRLRQILINLIGNAVKFTETGSVTVEVAHTNDTLLVTVRDTGIGIEPDHLDRIFEPFEQGDNSPSRVHTGTGLGLAISRKLAGMLGGDIAVTSRVGTGSCFTLTVHAPPVAHAERTDTLDPQTDPTETPVQTSPLTGRALLAEDGIDNQRLIAYFLSQAGLEVDVVANGREALDRLAQPHNPYDILITDMQMPVMDGYTATACLREMGSTIPVLALTAHAMAGDRERCLDVGCDDYEPKPINRASFIATVGRMLEKSRAQSACSEAA